MIHFPRGKYVGKRLGDPKVEPRYDLEEAKAQFQKSWDAWKAWAKLQEVA